MAIELRALGTKCNIGCLYCYQNPLRNSGNGNALFEPALIKQKLEELNVPFLMWGGEPLLLDVKQLEEMFAYNYRKFGENVMLTNGVLINDEHIRIFKQYNVRVVISCDGEGELNDARWAGTLKKTREATARTNANIYRLIDKGLNIALNFQVTKCNSSAIRIDRMFTWLRKMDSLGIESSRLHILEVDYSRELEPHVLTLEETVSAFIAYKHFEKELKNIRFDIFSGIWHQLLVDGQNVDCFWNACDPYTTEAVSGMDGQGRMNNCGLIDREGINFQKPAKQGFERYIALYYTPEIYGGCHGCRFFLICKGQCPGTAINGEWRNKSGNCEVWRTLFQLTEAELLNEGHVPVSCHPDLKRFEQQMLNQWADGVNRPLVDLLEIG